MRSERTWSRPSAAFPDHGIMAEEETSIRNASGFIWIIDPLDGTTNYAHGYPCFSVSIALEHEGELIVGVVYDPMRDELFSAEKGMGAYLNDRKIRVSSVDALIKSLLATGFPYDRKESETEQPGSFSRPADGFPGSAAGRLGSVGPLHGSVRPVRRFLGVETEAVGCRCGNPASCAKPEGRSPTCQEGCPARCRGDPCKQRQDPSTQMLQALQQGTQAKVEVPPTSIRG